MAQDIQSKQDSFQKNATRINGEDSFVHADYRQFGMNDNGLFCSKRATCKTVSADYIALFPETILQEKDTRIKQQDEHPPFLVLHGNVMYDMVYRSQVDTPYAESNVYEHTVQVYVDALIKNKYPFRLYLTNHFGNSSFLRNFFDIGLHFDQRKFIGNAREELKRNMITQNLRMPDDSLPSLPQLDSSIRLKKIECNGIRQWLSDPGILQKLIEEKERLLSKKDKKADTTIDSVQVAGLFKKLALPHFQWSHDTDTAGKKSSMALSIREEYQKKQQELDSLSAEIARLQTLYDKEQSLSRLNEAQLSAEVDNAKSPAELKALAYKYHVADSVLPAGYSTLAAVKSFGIGRSLVDYSELSAKNINITGVQVEYNPSCYIAVASGFIDDRFRDYLIQNANTQRQYLSAIRYGYGDKNGSHLILTYYTGKKQLYNTLTTLPGTASQDYNLMGFTLEGRFQVGKNNSIIAEIAKSSTPYYGRILRNKSVLGSAVDFRDHSNEAYSLKYSSFIPAAKTNIEASFSRIAANFQSFSLFTTGADHIAWMVKASQPLFKNKLTLTGYLKYNQFSDPYITSSYSSNTLFKSIQATWRKKKWPVITAGYFPSAQLTKLDSGQYVENLFYTFTTSVTYFYKAGKISMSTALIYTQFYNKVSDSGFAYYNSRNVLLNHALFLGKLNLQSSASLVTNEQYALIVLGESAQYRLNAWLTAGAGLKYNRQTIYNETQLGYSANATIQIKRIGDIQLMADKGFIPGPGQRIVPNNFGRVTYLKTF